MARYLTAIVLFGSLASCAKAQELRLYGSEFLTYAGGKVYAIKASDKMGIWGAYDAYVLQVGTKNSMFPVAAVWTLENDIAVSQPVNLASANLKSSTDYYEVKRFGDNSVMFSTTDEPVAISRNGQAIATVSKDKTSIRLKNGKAEDVVKLPARLLGISLNDDGTAGVVTFQNGTMSSLIWGEHGHVRLRSGRIKFAGPMFGPCWHGDTVALFASESDNPMSLGAIWLYNTKTSAAYKLRSPNTASNFIIEPPPDKSVVSVTATKQGFIGLDGQGDLFLFGDNGQAIKRYGNVPSLKGYYYDRGPISYDNLGFGNKPPHLAGGAPISIAFDATTIYAEDEFRKVKKGKIPNPSTPGRLTGS